MDREEHIELVARAYTLMRGAIRYGPTPKHWADLTQDERNQLCALATAVLTLSAEARTADADALACGRMGRLFLGPQGMDAAAQERR